MKIIKIFIALSITLIFLTGCQNVRENLSMKKKKSVDEFLIEKKNPLVLPPEFSELPKPKENDEKNLSSKKDESLDLSKVLGKSKDKIDSNSSNELEKSISDLLNKK